MLFHLTNLTPRLNKVSIRRDKSNIKSKKNDEIEKLSSSLASMRDDLVSVLKNEFKDSATHKRNFSFDISFSNPIDKILIKTSTVWSPSNCYIMSSFNDDKRSSAFTDNKKHYFANGGLKKVNRLEVIFQQTRSFKTYRSLISDNQRNPTILSRLKDAYSQQPAVGKGEKNSIVLGQTAQTTQNDSLNKLLNHPDLDNLSPEQKQQLKVAFAEGYLAANHPDNTKKDGRAIKYLKFFQQLLITVVFVGIFVSLFASNNGSVFR